MSETTKNEFSFCESVFATPFSRWHIRVVGPEGRKFGGGALAPLCYSNGCHQWINGWDLEVDFTEAHFDHACPACVVIYRQEAIEEDHE